MFTKKVLVNFIPNKKQELDSRQICLSDFISSSFKFCQQDQEITYRIQFSPTPQTIQDLQKRAEKQEQFKFSTISQSEPCAKTKNLYLCAKIGIVVKEEMWMLDTIQVTNENEVLSCQHTFPSFKYAFRKFKERTNQELFGDDCISFTYTLVHQTCFYLKDSNNAKIVIECQCDNNDVNFETWYLKGYAESSCLSSLKSLVLSDITFDTSNPIKYKENLLDDTFVTRFASFKDRAKNWRGEKSNEENSEYLEDYKFYIQDLISHGDESFRPETEFF